MKLHVLFAQRKERYSGEYGLEALEIQTEYDAEDNPAYLPKALEKHQATQEFEALAVVDLDVNEAEIRKALQPRSCVPAKVVSEVEELRD